jgi:hypothetical protein
METHGLRSDEHRPAALLRHWTSGARLTLIATLGVELLASASQVAAVGLISSRSGVSIGGGLIPTAQSAGLSLPIALMLLSLVLEGMAGRMRLRAQRDIATAISSDLMMKLLTADAGRALILQSRTRRQVLRGVDSAHSVAMLLTRALAVVMSAFRGLGLLVFAGLQAGTSVSVSLALMLTAGALVVSSRYHGTIAAMTESRRELSRIAEVIDERAVDAASSFKQLRLTTDDSDFGMWEGLVGTEAARETSLGEPDGLDELLVQRAEFRVARLRTQNKNRLVLSGTGVAGLGLSAALVVHSTADGLALDAAVLVALVLAMRSLAATATNALTLVRQFPSLRTVLGLHAIAQDAAAGLPIAELRERLVSLRKMSLGDHLVDTDDPDAGPG